MAQQLHQTGHVDLVNTGIDVSGGRTIGKLVGGRVESAVAGSPEAKGILNEADRKLRIAANAEARGSTSAAGRRVGHASVLVDEAKALIFGRSAAAGASAAQVASETAKKIREEAEKKKKEQGQ